MSWIGGKKALRELIVRLFPLYYERYIEVFGGGGWVLFHKPPGNDFEVYNDFNGLLVNLYRCVRDKPEELMETLRYVLNAREDFDRIRSALARDSPASDVQRAAWFYQLIRYSYASGLTSFGSQPHDTIVKDYTIQGWAMDSDRLKNGGSVLTREYFDHLLEQIREIRMSERKFYQKITDIYATALDYDKSSKTTRLFFSEVQNKLHWAIHRHTAAELIVERANAEKPHMGLTSWEQYPNGKIQKYDVSIAKNYLSREELQALERIVTMYLDYAEYQAGRHIPMTMQDWSQRLNRFLEFNEHEILHDTGRVTHEIAKAFAESEFEKYRIVQDRMFESDFDHFLALEEQAERKND